MREPHDFLSAAKKWRTLQSKDGENGESRSFVRLEYISNDDGLRTCELAICGQSFQSGTSKHFHCPDWWIADAVAGAIVFPPVELILTVINEGFIAGGDIRKRWLYSSSKYRCSFHEEGQGLFLANGEVIDPESFCLMDSTRSLPLKFFPDGKDDPEIRAIMLLSAFMDSDDPILYCGTCHDHFGHFLIEFLPRFWVMKYLDEDVRRELKLALPVARLKGWMERIVLVVIHMYGLKGYTLLGEGDVLRSKTILMPSLSYLSHLSASREAVNVFQDLRAELVGSAIPSTADGEEKIFLSRKVSLGRTCVNTTQVENAMRLLGYLVIYPEDYSLDEQVSIAYAAKTLAYFVGSASYLALFASNIEKCVALAPRDFFIKDDYVIASLLGAKLFVYFGSYLDDFGEYNSGTWSIDVDELLCSLSDV